MPNKYQSTRSHPQRWMTVVLLAAGIYNIAFGIWAVCCPNLWFDWSGMARPKYPEIWQSVGMIVGVYGLGYLIAATNPFRHWPIIFVGFLGKIFGPIGFIKAIGTGALPWSSAWVSVSNDLIWWIPFALILWRALQGKMLTPISRKKPYSPAEAAELYKLSSGEVLADISQDQTVVLVFLRHFGCTFTRQLLRGLQSLKEEADARGSRLVLVHMLQRNDEQNYLPGQATAEIGRIADPKCELYRAFGLRKGGFLEIFGPRVLWHGFLAFFKGCGIGHLAGDGLQMPGAFLFRKGEILAAQRARSASDLPDFSALFRVESNTDSQN